jgi:hypothetical protein
MKGKKKMYLDGLKKESNIAYTENGAVSNRSTMSYCLDLFATIGALRDQDENDILGRFIRAFAEDRDMALRTLFYARDIRGGLGERRTFRVILRWLAVNEPGTVRKNMGNIAEYGRFDDLLELMGTPCEDDMVSLIGKQLADDVKALYTGGDVSLLAKWLPSVNTSSREAVGKARRLVRALNMSEKEYRKTLSALRERIRIIENSLRKKDYTFEYGKQPSKALFKYRKAFIRNDGVRYQAFIDSAANDRSAINTGTLTPYDIIAPIVRDRYSGKGISEEERKAMDVTWNALKDYAGSGNSIAVVDGSGSMYFNGNRVLPAAVAQSLGIYFAERSKGAFHGHFITFSSEPKLVEIKGKDIFEKVTYTMSFDDIANTDIEKTFRLILDTAVKNGMKQEDMPEKLYIISDMEFDCSSNSGVTNFENAKRMFKAAGYRLPEVVFWNVASRSMQLPVTRNDAGAVLISGCSPQIFSMIERDSIDPYTFMTDILLQERYQKISA